MSKFYATMCLHLHRLARLGASLVPHDSNEKARKLNGLRACSVEMPGIEPGSDVAFARLLRAQSARRFIDLSWLTDQQLLGLVGFRSLSLPPTGATDSGYLIDARIQDDSDAWADGLVHWFT